MKRLFRLAIALATLTVVICGCQTKKSADSAPTATQQNFGAEFNQEKYIWEDFIFPSNKTTGR